MNAIPESTGAIMTLAPLTPTMIRAIPKANNAKALNMNKDFRSMPKYRQSFCLGWVPAYGQVFIQGIDIGKFVLVESEVVDRSVFCDPSGV